jgi:hypothetical protein
MVTIAFDGFQDGFDDAIGHAKADYRQGIPQPSVKNNVTGIPNPFEMKRKHIIPPGILYKILFRAF